LINTPMGKHAQLDDYLLRQAAIVNRVSYTTTMSAASAACDAILSLKSRRQRVKSLQEWQAELNEDSDDEFRAKVRSAEARNSGIEARA